MPQFSIGEIILNGKYRIEKLLGEGAFGEVYLATHLELDTLRALKVLRREGESSVGSTVYRKIRRRFVRESKLAAHFGNHPHIIQVMDFHEVEDLMVLAMEYAPGGSLQKRLENLREEGKLMPVTEVLRIAVEVAEGLSLLHKINVVHRDLKPGNILFDQDGHAKVADFGLAQMPHNESRRSTLSQPEPHPGTPGYMSPEQTRPPYDVLTPASDIYALGVVLFEMLTGYFQQPQLSGTRPSRLRPGLSITVDGLVMRMLSQNPQERPRNGAEAARLLRSVGQTSGKGKPWPVVFLGLIIFMAFCILTLPVMFKLISGGIRPVETQTLVVAPFVIQDGQPVFTQIPVPSVDPIKVIPFGGLATQDPATNSTIPLSICRVNTAGLCIADYSYLDSGMMVINFRQDILFSGAYVLRTDNYEFACAILSRNSELLTCTGPALAQNQSLYLELYSNAQGGLATAGNVLFFVPTEVPTPRPEKDYPTPTQAYPYP